ncbi:hypothetical protein NEHOM01_0131 [Nematocida homosporus]|uniref:uncharacterized protein n=1 Tax=Nematocida homosporus TaxID=1912981 RepID=UPI00221FD2F6|nr:uncharacterized protein NEHOM01_0131 [Nematocida homosporus]KAI5184386.1 hypothetical protein NEHOM01_0131 [Nematocida homosporus]
MKNWKVQAKTNKPNKTPKRTRSLFRPITALAVLAVLIAIYLAGGAKVIGDRLAAIVWVRKMQSSPYWSGAVRCTSVVIQHLRALWQYLKQMLCSVVERVPVLKNGLAKMCCLSKCLSAWIHQNICQRISAVISCGKSMADKAQERVKSVKQSL